MSRVSFSIWLVAAASAVFGLVWTVIKLFKTTSLALAFPEFTHAQIIAWSFLLFCIAIAVLTMSFIQVCRTIYPFRGHFQRRIIRAWFENAIQIAKDPSAANSWAYGIHRMQLWEEVSSERALNEFESMCSQPVLNKGYRSYVLLLYDLPLEQLCGQLTIAAESALDKPLKFRNLLLCLAGIESAEDLSTMVELRPSSSDREPNQSFAAAAEVQARSLLSRTIQRRIDAFQIEAGGRWRHTLQGVVMFVNVTFSWLVTAAIILRPGNHGPWFSYLIYAGLAGGLATFLSMLMRDLTAVIEVKRRQS